MCLTHLQYCRRGESIKSYDIIVCILERVRWLVKFLARWDRIKRLGSTVHVRRILENVGGCVGFSIGRLGFSLGLLQLLGAWFLVL